MTGAGVAPRRAALAVLRDAARGAYADRAAAARFRGLPPPDRGLAQELAFGAIRLRGRLDRELERLSRRPLARLDAPVLAALRLGLYQIRETRIPPHAAVDATVDAAGLPRGARGVVNAVLRRASREGRPAGLFPDPEEDPAGYLATWGSHPEWLVRRWLARYPLASVRRLVELDNEPPPVTFRRLAASPAEEPGDARLEPVEGRSRLARLVAGTPAEVIASGGWIAQDPAASAVVDYVGPGLEGPVVDLCAAPGGKTIGLWFATGARPMIAADVSPERLRRVRDLSRDTGARPWLLAMDGRRPAIRGARSVLLDAPCSGTGVLRRRPDARWRLRPERIEALVERQRELLASAADLVTPGGLLVYATCSLEPEENEAQVDRFLAGRPDYERDATGPLDGRDLHVQPWESDSDGAYASRLRKRRTG